jgi:hypothetical protein
MGIKTISVRRWWEDRTAKIAIRWESDSGFRHSFSLLVTAMTLVLVGICLLVTIVVVHQAVPQWFEMAPGGVNPGGGSNGGEATFPVVPLTPQATAPNIAPIAVATSNQGPLVQLTPSPLPFPTSVATNVPSCPTLTNSPVLGGRNVLDGTLPAPLQGGCPAQIVIYAASLPNAPVTITLTFGKLDPISCTLTLAGTTDDAGNAAISFTVPGRHCYQGDIVTSGTISVGGDNSVNASFSAQA